jgi:hypothetical protein
MVQLSHQTYDIQRVRDILPCDGGTQVVFPTSLSACLRRGHPDYERILHHARGSLQDGSPVAVLVNEGGELVQLNYTHRSAVRHVRPDDEDPTRLMVEFWVYSPICYLTKDHPEYERIKHTLEHAAASNTQVIFANHMHMIEGKAETWWKLMDVRPA